MYRIAPKTHSMYELFFSSSYYFYRFIFYSRIKSKSKKENNNVKKKNMHGPLLVLLLMLHSHYYLCNFSHFVICIFSFNWTDCWVLLFGAVKAFLFFLFLFDFIVSYILYTNTSCIVVCILFVNVALMYIVNNHVIYI